MLPQSPGWRNRVGARVAAAGLSLAILGSGAAIASEPVNAATTKVTVPATKVVVVGPTTNRAGWAVVGDVTAR